MLFRSVGSVARGDDDENSDVDILIDIDSHRENSFRAISSAAKISKLVNRDVDVLPTWMCKKEVLKSVLSDAIPL